MCGDDEWVVVGVDYVDTDHLVVVVTVVGFVVSLSLHFFGYWNYYELDFHGYVGFEIANVGCFPAADVAGVGGNLMVFCCCFGPAVNQI